MTASHSASEAGVGGSPPPVPVRADTPQRAMELFVERVHGRDLDGLVALYEPDAVFKAAPDVVVTGREAIGAALAELLVLEPSMQLDVSRVFTAGDVALVVNDWAMTGTAPDGSPVTDGGRSADVLRRQPDGTWLVLIDHP